MITSERLEELIKQEEWVWLIDDEQKCFGLKLSNKFHIKDNSLRSEVETVYATLNNIFETKDRAEWALKTIAERTERFEPPMWEDIELPYHYRFTINNSLYVFDISNGKITILKQFKCLYDLFEKPATKENYIKACEIVRDLFNKGNKE